MLEGSIKCNSALSVCFDPRRQWQQCSGTWVEAFSHLLSQKHRRRISAIFIRLPTDKNGETILLQFDRLQEDGKLLSGMIEIESSNVVYTDDYMQAGYQYETCRVRSNDTGNKIKVSDSVPPA